jgi:molybdate transport system permease protein
LKIALKITLPLAWKGLLAGIVLSFSRALGEFGATMMLAGNIPGRTNTLPLEIFRAFQTGDDRGAAIAVALLTGLSLLVVFVSERLGQGVYR